MRSQWHGINPYIIVQISSDSNVLPFRVTVDPLFYYYYMMCGRHVSKCGMRDIYKSTRSWDIINTFNFKSPNGRAVYCSIICTFIDEYNKKKWRTFEKKSLGELRLLLGVFFFFNNIYLIICLHLQNNVIIDPRPTQSQRKVTSFVSFKQGKNVIRP